MIGWIRRRRQRKAGQDDAAILAALDDGNAHYVLRDLDKATAIHVGNMYPALARLEPAGQVESGWADTAPGRRRRWYRTTNPT